MDWWTTVRLVVQTFLDQHGVLAAFLLILIEEAGVPVPVPGDFLMLVMGVRARQGQVPLWQAIAVMELATLVGATALYALTVRAGRGLVYRYGRFMHLSPARLDRAEQWLQRRGFLAVVLGRVVPGLRIATVIACGVFALPLWRFLPALGLGALAYILLYTLLGYFLGPRVLALLEGIHLPLGLLGSLVPLLALLVWIGRAHRAIGKEPHPRASAVDHHHRLRDGAIAGGVATVVSTLLMNVLVHLAGDLAVRAPGLLIEKTAARLSALALARDVGPLLLVLAVPAFIGVGVVWGAIYAGWVEPRLQWPDWSKGLAFALLPLSVALLVVLPALESASPRVGSVELLGALSETIRHLTYGLTLGVTYPLRLARRPPRPRPHRSAGLTGSASAPLQPEDRTAAP